MFTSCIGCTKPAVDEEQGGEQNGTPRTKEAVKSLGSQICLLIKCYLSLIFMFLRNQFKDMALKFTGAYKQCKPCSGSNGSSSSNKKGQKPYPDFETISEGVPYPYFGGSSSTSTPAFDITSSNFPGGRSDRRFGFSGDRVPRVPQSESSADVAVGNSDETREWLAQVEPGVSISFLSLPNGGNDLKRIRFRREMFDKWQAQKWWGENYDRILELYNVRRFNHQVFNTPPRSEDEQRDSSYSRLTSGQESPGMMSLRDWTQRNRHSEANDQGGGGQNLLFAGSSVEPSRTTTSSRDERSISNASDIETQWIEQDEPGVSITIRQCADGTKELRRVRFSRERFGEGRAKKWWEDNRERIEAQYL